MVNQIDVLSPGTGCQKTRRLVRFLEDFVRKHPVHAQIRIITDRRTLLTYRTWILPSVFINGEVVARGYRPSEKNLLKYLKPKRNI